MNDCLSKKMMRHDDEPDAWSKLSWLDEESFERQKNVLRPEVM